MLDDRALDVLFRQARTYNAFSGPVTGADLKRIYELMKWGPTTANSCPARFVFVCTPEAKKKLEPALSEGNRAKTMAAPVTAIIAYDTRFYDLLPTLFPHNPDARSWFAGEAKAKSTEAAAFRNGSLQGAYFILAARAAGFDCGPMSGFDNAKVDATFFPDGQHKSNFLCNLGRGDPKSLFPRSPRLAFEEAVRIE